MYTLSTRTIRKRGLANLIVTEKVVQTIEYKGQYYADLPEGEDAAEVLATLNAAEAAATEYRAQFTDSEWERQMDEASGG